MLYILRLLRKDMCYGQRIRPVYSGVEGNSFNRRKQGSSARHY